MAFYSLLYPLVASFSYFRYYYFLFQLSLSVISVFACPFEALFTNLLSFLKFN